MEKITPEIALYALPSSRKDFKKTFNDIYWENFDAHDIDDQDDSLEYDGKYVDEWIEEYDEQIKSLGIFEEKDENEDVDFFAKHKESIELFKGLFNHIK